MNDYSAHRTPVGGNIALSFSLHACCQLEALLTGAAQHLPAEFGDMQLLCTLAISPAGGESLRWRESGSREMRWGVNAQEIEAPEAGT